MRLARLTDVPRARRSIPLSAAFLLALAGCASTAVVPSGTTPVDTSFQRTTGGFSDGAAIEVAVAAREAQGNLAICGAWVFQPQGILSRSVRFQALDTGQVQVDGRTTLRRLERFPQQPEGASLEGANALCLRTEQAWSPDLASAKVRVRFPRSVYERDVEDGFRGIIFRERRGGR